MRNNSKVEEASKSKNDQPSVALKSSVKEIQRVADANQLRLQHLELAVANLTSICSVIRNDIYTLTSSTNRKVRAEAIENKRRTSSTRSRSPSIDLKDDVLGIQMEQLVKQAAALGILKDSRTNSFKLTGSTNANIKTPTSTRTAPKKLQATTKPAPKKVQATTKQKSSTKPPLRNMESTTTEKKLSMKLATAKNHNVGATQPKAKNPPENNNKNMKATTAATTKVSLKSSVKNTKTTISKVYLNQSAANKSKEITVKNNVKTTTSDKGSVRLTIKAHDQVHKSYSTAVKSHALTSTDSSCDVAKSDLKPRRKWKTPERNNTSEVKEFLGIYGNCQSI